MNWFKRLLPKKIRIFNRDSKQNIPEGLWTKCDSCESFLIRTELEKNFYVCPKCSKHMKLKARQRLKGFLDQNDIKEIAKTIEPIDHLKFKDTKRYKDRLSAAQKKTGEKDALVVYAGKLNGLGVVCCAFEFDFIGGSMGTVVGEKFVRAVKHCLKYQLSLICFATSGGARMQESLFALMQMPKTSAAIALMKQANLPYISVMIDPCTGGVSASLAMLGDINIAEPNALIGFAGPRVIEQTVRETLPEGFQRSEFLLKTGAIDMIVDRRELRNTITNLIDCMRS